MLRTGSNCRWSPAAPWAPKLHGPPPMEQWRSHTRGRREICIAVGFVNWALGTPCKSRHTSPTRAMGRRDPARDQLLRSCTSLWTFGGVQSRMCSRTCTRPKDMQRGGDGAWNSSPRAAHLGAGFEPGSQVFLTVVSVAFPAPFGVNSQREGTAGPSSGWRNLLVESRGTWCRWRWQRRGKSDG